MIRAARGEDSERLVQMRLELWPEGSKAEHRRELERFFAGEAREPQQILVAEQEAGGLVGFCELSIRPFAEGCRTDRVGYLEGWYVASGARRCGVGGALVRAAEEWARGQGCSEIASDAAVDNEVSAEAHLALGFEDAGLVRCFRKNL